MPQAAFTICRQQGCGARCAGPYCAKHAGEHPRRQFDRARGSAASRGYGRRHEKWRKLVLHRDPLCKINKTPGCTAELPRPSTIADHVTPVNAGGDWAMENGQGACEPCHNWKTRTIDLPQIEAYRRQNAG